MDIDLQETEAQFSTSFLAKLLKVINNVQNWILGPFLLTEEEKKEAGIYIGRMGEDD